MNVSMAITVQMDVVKIQRDPSDVFVPRVSNCLHQKISVKVRKIRNTLLKFIRL